MASNGRFCGSCGHEMPTAATVAGKTANHSKKIVIIMAVVVLIGLAGLVAGVVWPRLQADSAATPTVAIAETSAKDEMEVVVAPTDSSEIIPAATTTPTDTASATGTLTTATLATESAALPTATPTTKPTLPPPPTPTPAVDEIVFQSNRDGDYEIYIMHINGDQQRPLTDNRADDQYPRVSPDGRRITFESNRDGNPEIYVMNRDGSDQTRLTFDSANDRLPTWSPDSQQITFQSGRSGVSDLYIINADGSDLRQVANTPAREGHTSWSVNDKLVFNASQELYWQIYVSNLDGSGRQQLTHTRIDEWSPEWSPDGSQILFMSEQGSSTNAGIYVMNADGSDARLLYNSAQEEWGPVWSGDGSKILFTVDQPDGSADIFMMNADGSNVYRVSERGGYPSWAGPQPSDYDGVTATIQDVEVIATANRTTSDLALRAGQTVIIEYIDGTWQAGPSPTWPPVGPEGDAQVPAKNTFPIPNQPVMSLIAGIDDGVPHFVGNRLEWTVEEDGYLWLGPNDDGIVDNSGVLFVRVTVLTPGDKP